MTGNDAGLLGGDKNEGYYMALSVLAMSDLNDVDIAIAVHERVLEGTGALTPDTKLMYRHKLPTGPLFDGVYADDRMLVAKVL